MRIKKLFITGFIIAFLLVGATGAAYSGMTGTDAMGMIGCPLMGHDAAVCTMNIFAHLGAWQSLFAATVEQNAVFALLLLLVVFFFTAAAFVRHLLEPPPVIAYVSASPEISTHDPLRCFIARGLMHPKIF